MEFKILGPLEVWDGGRRLTPRPGKQRALLQLLLLRPNRAIPVDDLVEALWGEAPPDTAHTALHGHVSSLRKLLGAERIQTAEASYALRLEPRELDVMRFEELVAAAGKESEPAARARLYKEALALWRGEPAAGFAHPELAEPLVVRLRELYLSALEQRIDADLALGQHREVIPELEQLIAAEPLREEPRRQLMVALYRSGRQADALSVYEEFRRAFSVELGLDPGAQLQRLHQQILSRDPALDLAVKAPPQTRQARKLVTVLVAELEPTGSSDPEEMERVITQPLSRGQALLEQYGATVQPLFANGLVAVFGAYQAHEDDPERAVRAGIALRDALSKESAFSFRAGIECGSALVTLEDARVEVTGSVLAAASRLQAHAATGAVLAGEGVYRSTSEAINYEQEPGDRYLVMQAKRRVRSPIATDDLPFMGRERETALLESIFARAIEGRPQLALIAADAGGGKSRLAREFRLKVEAGAAHAWREGRCLPYGDGVTFWALGEIVKEEAGILESDSPVATVEKLHQAVSALLTEARDRSWMESALAPLVGVSDPSTPGLDQLMAAWRRFLEALAAREPLVVLIEDMQWADSSLVAFVENLADEMPDSPLLIVCTARLEFLESHPGWSGGKRNTVTIALPPLDEISTGALFEAILGKPPEPRLVRQAGGNPLFAQELARMVSSAPQTSRVIPETVQSVIAARLDTLEPVARETAMHASVVGEVFWSGAVAYIAGVDQHVADERLRQLQRGQFIRRLRNSAVKGQAEYAFGHALVKDVAYDSIPIRKRAHLHELAAKWIEGLAGERVADHADFVAHHYSAALDLMRAAGAQSEELSKKTCEYLILAGDRAMRLDVIAAERFYRRALELTPDSDSLRPTTLARIASAAQERGRLHEAQPIYEEAIAAFGSTSDWLNAARALMDLSRVLWRIGSSERQAPLIDEAIKLLEPHPLGPDLARAWMLKGRELVHLGQAAESLPWSERALIAADQVNRPDIKVWSLMYRGMARVDLADPRGAVDMRDSLQLGLDLGLGLETAICYANLGDFVSLEDGPEHGLRMYQEGIRFSERRGLVHNLMWIKSNMPFALFQLGEWDGALREGDEVLEWDRTEGTSQLTLFVLAVKSQILTYRGLLEEAKTAVDQLLPLARSIGGVHALVHALPSAALYLNAIGDSERALELIREVELATRGSGGWRSHRIAECARMCIHAGEVSLAEALLTGAATYPKLHSGLVLTAQAAVAEARGDHRRARGLFHQAREFWAGFGNQLEFAIALQGEARSLAVLGQKDEAREAAEAARRVRDGLGMRDTIADSSS